MTDSLDTVRQAYESLNRGEDLVELGYIAEDVEWVNPAEAMEPGTRRGHEGWRRVAQMMSESFASMRLDVQEIREAPDGRVVVLGTFHQQGRGSGVETEVELGHVLTLRDGRLARLEWHFGHDTARAAAGLA